jgi:hypothetical protein
MRLILITHLTKLITCSVIGLFIGTEKLVLFSDENITINSSIADVSDITINTTDYTKTFTVPANNANNETFRHYYEANIDGGFDARIKQAGHIELDGIPFKIGKWRLNKVNIVNGVASSYTINFWGNLVSMKDTLKKDELKDLDLSAFDHDYSSSNVQTGLTSSLFSGDMVYNPFVKKQLFFNADGLDSTQSETLSNIAFGGGVDAGLIWNDLRPSIRIIKIIEAIETDYDLTFSRDFFGRAEFNNLFMWLNADSGDDIGGDSIMVDFDSGDSTYMNLTTNIGRYPTENPTRTRWNMVFEISPEVGYTELEYTIVLYAKSGGISFEERAKWTNTGKRIFESSFNWDGSPVDWDIYYEVQSSQEFKFTSRLRQVERSVAFSGAIDYDTFASLQTIPSKFISSENMPKIKLIDFLKGLFNMFKLVVIPEDDGSIYINTLKDYYLEGNLLNITRYADTNNYEVARGDILNEILFKYKDPSTILNQQFDKNTGIPYGNEETFLFDDDGELLDGDSLDFELPFEQIVYERLYDLNDDIQTNFQYGAVIDLELSPSNPKPHIFYNVNQTIGAKTLGFINDSGTKINLGSVINLPSYTESFEDSDFSTLFSEEFNTWDGALISNTLYTNYHIDYVLAIFNQKRRNFKYNVKNFPLRFLPDLGLNDLIQIKSDYYRIDNFNTNLLTGEVEFNLINSFDNTIAGFFPDRTQIFVDYLAQQESIYVVNLTNFSYVKVDLGFGVGWVTVSSSGSNIFFDFDANDIENSTASTREMTVTITNDFTLQTFDVLLNQTEKPYVPSINLSDDRNLQYLAALILKN